MFVESFLGDFSESQWQEWRDELDLCSESLEKPNIGVRKLISLLKDLAISLKSFCLLPPLVVTIESTKINSPSDKENIASEALESITENVISDKWLELLKLNSDDQNGITEMDSSYGLSSMSQLFVNYCILEKSLDWEMSAEKIGSRCHLCNRRITNLSDRVICDRCNHGNHRACLVKKHNREFKNKWICLDCSPVNGQTVIVPEPEIVGGIETCDYCTSEIKENVGVVSLSFCFVLKLFFFQLEF